MAKVLDHGYVDYCYGWGSDEDIIRAARMSTNKGFQGWGETCPFCNGFGRETTHVDVPVGMAGETAIKISDVSCSHCNGEGKLQGDEKLLGYLYNHKHMTPFEMAGMVIEVQAPIMVFREWHRHRTQSYNEMSGRYTELPNLYYIPEVDRIQKQSSSNKQGSAEILENADKIQWVMRRATENARECYEALLEQGVAREIARLILPVNQYSRMRASANLRNWLAFLTLRQDPAAQYEIRMYANEVAKLIEAHFPRTYKLFSENNT